VTCLGGRVTCFEPFIVGCVECRPAGVVVLNLPHARQVTPLTAILALGLIYAIPQLVCASSVHRRVVARIARGSIDTSCPPAHPAA
jgi:hypothetical protein